MKKLSREKLIFTLIISIASILRLWNYGGWSFTHDELSAIVRLQNDSLYTLMIEGIRPDGHPTFVQIFLYLWTNIFGLSEAATRLPFVFTGVGSVVLLYLVAKKWFGYTTAYFASLTFAILDFPILYSQLALPNVFELFFVLLTTWCWTNLLFGTGNNRYRKIISYCFSIILCLLAGNNAFFFAMFTGMTGVFFLKKEICYFYLLFLTVVVFIYFSRMPVFIYLLDIGENRDWFTNTWKDFLWKDVLYVFNNSPLVVISIVLITLLSVLIYHLDITFSRFQAVCILWFIAPFLAGYYYSVNPVFHYSLLLFSLPFLLLFLFSFFRERKEKFNNISLIFLGVILLFSTVAEQQFYTQEHFGVFKEITITVSDLQEKYGSKNITTVLNTSQKEIFDFYFKQKNQQVDFDFYAGNDSSFVADMLRAVEESTTPYFIYGWSNFRSPYEVPEIIKRKYPCIIYDEKHFNSQVTLFGKLARSENKNISCGRDTIFYTHAEFEPRAPLLIFDTTKVDTLYAHSGKHSLKIESTNIFCITYRTVVKNFLKNDSGCVSVSAWIYTQEPFRAQLVMDIGQPTGKRDWQARLLNKFIYQPRLLSSEIGIKKQMWQQVFATFELPPNVYPDDEVKVHLWNPYKNSFFLDDVTISSFADSRYDYYAPSFRK
jgi:hypothetical protein